MTIIYYFYLLGREYRGIRKYFICWKCKKFMKKVWVLFFGVMFFSLVAGASYPEPFTSNTATVVGSSTPITNIEATSDTTNLYLTTASTEIETDKKLFSEKEICRLVKGCWNEEECSPYGYRNDDAYCGEKMRDFNGELKLDRITFMQQKNATEQCKNSFECKNNFCFNGECVDTIKTVDDEVIQIDKSDLEELRSIIENAEDSLEEGYSEEVSMSFFGSLISLFQNVFGF